MEGQEEKQKILFSGIGYSDPVSGNHDGAMLHIVRRYKPTHVYLFMTAEMKQHQENDDRYRIGIKSLEKSIGYCPEIIEKGEDIVDADNFDVFMEPFESILNEILDNHPGAQILLNLSSGTIQMKMTMCLLATDEQYRAKGVLGVQVRNWATSGKSKSIAIEEILNQLENNEDDKRDSIDRCLLAKTRVLHRDRTKKQISALIDKYNYRAAIELFTQAKESYEDKIDDYKRLLALLEHAAARQERKEDDARAAIKDLQIDEAILYPINDKTSKCYELMEFFLILKNYQSTERYTDMVIRMNPFVIALQEECLNSIPDFSVEDIIDDENGDRLISVDKIKKKDDELLKYINDSKRLRKNKLSDSWPSITVYNLILEYFEKNKRLEKLKKQDIRFLWCCANLNKRLRNDAAHSLKCVVEDEIIKATATKNENGMNAETIIKRFKELLQHLYGYDKCPEGSFSVYDTINGEIKRLL